MKEDLWVYCAAVAVIMTTRENWRTPAAIVVGALALIGIVIGLVVELS